jgi:glutamine synthetase
MSKNETGTWQAVATLAEKNGCQFVDLKFVDLPGIWQHFTIPATPDI